MDQFFIVVLLVDTTKTHLSFLGKGTVVRDMELLPTINLTTIGRAPEEVMDEKRKDFLFENVRPFVSIGEKIY